MNNPFQQHGAFSWCELMTSDPDAAKTFYGRLFGWEMEDRPMAGMVYTVLSAGGQEVGGLTAIPNSAPGMQPTWGTYVTVDDADATAALAAELGGKVLMPPRDIPDVGRFTLIQDPQGAIFSAIAYRNPRSA
ncbi:MAG: VOC family protein [Thermosynechococcaceae cyanobacterium]